MNNIYDKIAKECEKIEKNCNEIKKNCKRIIAFYKGNNNGKNDSCRSGSKE